MDLMPYKRLTEHFERAARGLPADEIKPVPSTYRDWTVKRAAARGLNVDEVL